MAPLRPSGAFALLCVACLTIMVGCVVVPGLPGIAQALGVGGAPSWLVTLPSLGVVLFGPMAGWLITREGSLRALVVGLVLYGAIGLACVVLRGPVAVFTDRLLLGGATALVMSAGTGLISDFYTGSERLAMIARQGMAIELGGVVFLAMGGLLARLGWSWPFLLYLMAWVFLALVAAFVPAPPRRASSTQETVGAASLFDLLQVYVLALLSMVIFFTAVISLPLDLHVRGVSESQTGYFLSCISLVAVVAAFMLPRLSRRIGESGTLGAGFVAYALAHALFASTSAVTSVLIGGALLGIAFGLTIPLVNHMTVERSHPAGRGRNLAYLSMAIFLGQFLSSFVGAFGTGATAYGIAALLALLGLAASLLQKARRAVMP